MRSAACARLRPTESMQIPVAPSRSRCFDGRIKYAGGACPGVEGKGGIRCRVERVTLTVVLRLVTYVKQRSCQEHVSRRFCRQRGSAEGAVEPSETNRRAWP